MRRFVYTLFFITLALFLQAKSASAATCAAEYTPASQILTYTTLTARISNTTATHEYEVTLTKSGSSTPLYLSTLEVEGDNEIATFEIPLSEYAVEPGTYNFSARDTSGGNCTIAQNRTITITNASEDRCPLFTGSKPFPATRDDVIILEFSRGGQNATKNFDIQINTSDTYTLGPGVRRLILQRFPVGSYSFTVSSLPGQNDCPEGAFEVSPPECRREGNTCDDANPCCAGFTCGGSTEYTTDTCYLQQLSPNQPPPITPPCAGGECNTALGSFSVGNIGQFVSQVFRFVLAIGGAGAVLLIIYAGFLLIISRGDKERIASARQIMTAAIGGLVFIILSFAILSFIGNTVLNLPGF